MSPYVTECPYCGTRLQKRAPKLDKGLQPTRRSRRVPAPSLGRLRPGEIPGIRADSRPYATGAIILATGGVWIATRAGWLSASSWVVRSVPRSASQWPHLITDPFTYFYASGADSDGHRRLPVRDAAGDRDLRLAARAPLRWHRRAGAVPRSAPSAGPTAVPSERAARQPSHRRRQRRRARAPVRVGGARPARPAREARVRRRSAGDRGDRRRAARDAARAARGQRRGRRRRRAHRDTSAGSWLARRRGNDAAAASAGRPTGPPYHPYDAARWRCPGARTPPSRSTPPSRGSRTRSACSTRPRS